MNESATGEAIEILPTRDNPGDIIVKRRAV
jgi:hypothetical protein